MNSKTDIVHNLTVRLPDSFGPFFDLESRIHADANGGVTLYGLFSTLSRYIRRHYEELSDEQHVAFWEWIEWQCQSTDAELTNAIGTCFLENIEGTEAERHSRPFMPKSIAACFEYPSSRKKRWFEQ